MADNNSHKLKLGLIGAGKWGINYINTIREINNLELIYVSTTNPHIKNIVSSRCVISRQWEDLLSVDSIDGIIISSPPKSHYSIAKQFINKGIPVLIEKPLTVSSFDSDNLLSIVNKERKPSIVFVDHIYLYDYYFRNLKQRSKKLGQIKSIISKGGANGPFRKDVRALWDWAPHDIAMCLDIVGELPISINAEIVKKQNSSEDKRELIKIILEFSNKLYANLLIGNFMNKKERLFEVNFENHTLIYNPLSKISLQEYSKIDEKNLPDKKKPLNCLLPLDQLLKEFGEAILKGKKNISGLELGVKVVKIIEDIEKIIN